VLIARYKKAKGDQMSKAVALHGHCGGCLTSARDFTGKRPHLPLFLAMARQTGRRTLNHAAYNAGRNNSVRTVATINPPMIATAIGPQNTERESGIIASTAVAAVKIIGLKRRTAEPTIASQTGMPAEISCSI
jgi:hypothetical protein